MPLDALGSPGLHVGRRAHLQRDASITHVRGQPSQLGLAVRGDLDVVDDADAVTQPVGSTPLQRLPDAREPERLARVDREVRVLPTQVLEGVEMTGRREPRLRPRDVEAHDAAVAVLDGELGDTTGVRGRADRGEEDANADRVSGLGRQSLTLGEACQHGLDHLVLVQPLLDMQLGGEPHLRVDHEVGRKILGALARDPAQRLRGLGDTHRVRERLQVPLQRPGGGGLDEPGAQLVGIRARQPVVPVGRRELDDRPRPQPTVQVVVEEHLRRARDEVGGNGGVRAGVGDHAPNLVDRTTGPPSPGAGSAAGPATAGPRACG